MNQILSYGLRIWFPGADMIDIEGQVSSPPHIGGRVHGRPHSSCGQPAACSQSMQCRRVPLFFLFLVKKAYMPIDANHISNPKDR